MLAYGLYKQGLVTQGNEIMQEVYEIANNTEKAQIFPGIPHTLITKIKEHMPT